MTAQELKETRDAGHRLFEAGQYVEALPLLKSAADMLPKDELLWQDLLLAATRLGHHDQAMAFAKQALSQHPRSDWLWRQLGSELIAMDRLDEAETALNSARSLNPNAEFLWRYFSDLHRKRKNLEGEIAALRMIVSLDEANSVDLNRLGTAYFTQRDFGKALEFYRLSVAVTSDVAPLFNMGLVYNATEVSQDVDATDAYRRALLLKPDYVRAKEHLDTTRKKLVPLAEAARSLATGLIPRDDYFRFYASPFELFQISTDKPVEELDAKLIQRAKKRLLQEIDVNDGKVSWLDDYELDKSRALALEDELQDNEKCRFHRAVFQNQRLLRFMTRGEIDHFLYSDGYFPSETLDLLDEEPEFRQFLSKPFSRQYNLLLTRAIDEKLLHVVEVLFDGRRWVKPEDEDTCFEGAFKRIGDLLGIMRAKVEEGREKKFSFSEVEAFLNQHSFVGLFNLLPAAFASAQRDIVAAIRSLAISCFNDHNDAELSKRILALCKRFTSRSVELTNLLEKDFKTIEGMIAEERKYSFNALVRHNEAVRIDKGMIAYNGVTIHADDISAVRWGVYVHTVNGIETERMFSLIASAGASCLTVAWCKRGLLALAQDLFRKPGAVVPIVELSSEKQEEYFGKMIDAMVHHLIPSLVAKITALLHANKVVVVGPCKLSRGGITVSTGFFFSKEHLVPWPDAEVHMRSGEIVVLSRGNRKIRVTMPAKDTDNAVILPFITGIMAQQSN